MFASLFTVAAITAATLTQPVAAQQWAGEVIPQPNLTTVGGTELAYWKIGDPAGTNVNLTLTTYSTLQKNGQRLDPLQVRRAVIVIHGLQRDAGTYAVNMMSAIDAVNDTNINRSTVQIVAPIFPNGDDKNISYPYYNYSATGSKYSGGKQSNTSALVWKGSQWISGQPNQYPWYNNVTSPYDCIDQMLQFFDNKAMYPNLNQIVLAGHSAGAQTVDRYSAVQKNLNLNTPVTFWIGNPNDWLYLNSSRPFSTSTCPTYDNWRTGLTNYSGSGMLYNTALVAQGSDAVKANYMSKNHAYARGTLDLGDDSSGCEPFAAGMNRNERFFQFINWWRPTCPKNGALGTQCDTVDYVPIGHDGGAMFGSAPGLARIFTDNFYGDGSRLYDYGYPRMQVGDDPFPDPTRNSTIPGPSMQTYAGNMTYQGCWSDMASVPAMRLRLYDDSTIASVDACTQACSDKGYRMAGLEYGTQCFCDNTLDSSSLPALDTGCTFPCGANANQVCGDYSRLSVYASGSAAIHRNPPTSPATIGNYSYAGCYTEATVGRALSGASYTDTANMTLESCAKFCNGANYFGIEYAQECYCGSYLRNGSAITDSSNCAKSCTGNETERCGGSYVLNVYQSPTANGSTALTAASFCPTMDGKNYTDTNNQTYTINCSMDTTTGAFSQGSASESYISCMSLCDAAAGCAAFTYVGATNGDGSGTCYLKQSYGTSISRTSSYISGARPGSSSGTTSTSASTSPAASASLGPSYCPMADNQIITDNLGNSYTVRCSSDSSQGSFAGKAATSNYMDCMTLCDGTSGCTAFTYVGGTYGSGSGTCWFKTVMGSAVSSGTNYISAARFVNSTGTLASSTSASGSSTSGSSTSGSNTSAAATTTLACPGQNQTVYTASTGARFLIECGFDHYAGDMGSAGVSSGDLAGCIAKCVATAGCVDVSLSGAACYMKNAVNSVVYNNNIWGARLLLNSSTSTTAASSAAATSSTAASSTAATSSASVSVAVTSAASLSTTAASTTTSPSSPAAPSSTLSSAFVPIGCFVDNNRPLSVSNGSSSTNTPNQCALNCRSMGYRYSGTEYSQECWCGNYLPPTNASSSDCNMACTGDRTQMCGAGSRLSVVQDTAWVQMFFARPTYASWKLQGCFADSTGSRLIPNRMTTTGGTNNLTIANCMDSCQKAGYSVCGAEYYGECYGGNTSPNATAVLGTDPLQAGCNYPCYGNSTEACGGSNRILVYTSS